MPDHLGKVQGPRAASIKAVWPSWFGTSTLLPVSTVRLLRGSSRAEPNASIPRAPRRSGWKRPRLSPAQVDELQALAALPDAAIDTSDVPEVLDWTGAKRGLFYRPVKQQLTLRLDADLIAWFKAHATAGEGYQTRINRVLRAYVRGETGKDAPGL